MTVDQLRARRGHHVERVVAGPLHQVFDELEQRRVGPLHVLEHQHRRLLVCEPLEEQAPGAEQVFTILSGAVLESQQLRQPRFDPTPLIRVGEELDETALQLGQRGRRVLTISNPRTHAHHFRERPVGHPLSVGETASTVGVDQLGDTVDVLEELPGEPRFADPGDSHH